MRGKWLIFVAAMAFSPPSLSAQVQTTPLAANEVLLQIHAKGSVRSPAQLVSLVVYLQTNGPTPAAARAKNAEMFEEMIAALKKAGGDPNRVRVLGPTRSMGFIGNEAYARGDGEGAGLAMLAARADIEPPAKPPIKVDNQIEVQFTDVSLIDKIRDGIEATGAKVASLPMFSLFDDAECNRQARAQAISKAQEMARSYAAALGFPAIRLVRVSDQGSGIDGPTSIDEMMQQMSGTNNVPVGQVETNSYIWADFALGPKQ